MRSRAGLNRPRHSGLLAYSLLITLDSLLLSCRQLASHALKIDQVRGLDLEGALVSLWDQSPRHSDGVNGLRRASMQLEHAQTRMRSVEW